MTRWIRWKGLMAIAAIIGMAAGLWTGFGGVVVKAGLQKVGTLGIGGEVRIEHADPDLFPPGLTLDGVTVADPSGKPEHLVTVEQVVLRLSFAELLSGRVAISDMTALGMEFGTPARKVVAGKRDSEAVRSEHVEDAAPSRKREISLPEFALPDVETLLSREPLASVAEARRLETEIAGEFERLGKKTRDAIGKDRLKRYENRFRAIRKKGSSGLGGFLGAVEDTKKLRKDLQRDIRELKALRKEIRDARSIYQRRVSALPKLARRDVDRLVMRYRPNGEGLGNLAALVLGHPWGMRARKALSAYARLAPHLDGKEAAPKKALRRDVGEEIHFGNLKKKPALRIDRAKLSIRTAEGHFTGDLTDLVSDPELAKAPLRLTLEGKGIPGVERLGMVFSADRRSGRRVDRLAVDISGWDVTGSGEIPFATGTGTGRLDLTRDAKSLAGDGTFRISGATLEAAEAGSVEALFADAIRSVARLELAARIEGEIASPNVRLSSNLDTVVETATRALIAQAEAKLRDRIEGAIATELGGDYRELGGLLATFSSDLEAGVNDRLSELGFFFR